jgi:small-conductance mechanosensitive channel
MEGNVGELLHALNLERIASALLIDAVAAVASRLVTRTLDRLGESRARRRLMFKKISSITRFAIFILATVVVLTSVVDFNRDAWLALGGTMAVTIGFALKDTVASLVSGILILIDQPFQVGDRITFGPHYGEVKEIGLRMVRIVTLDDNLVSIPTNKFLTDEVASGNAGELDMMVVIDFFIDVDADFALAKRLAYEATVTSKYVYLNKPVVVLLTDEMTPTGLATRVRVKAYVVDTRFEKRMVSDVTERVKTAFREVDLRPPHLAVGPTAAAQRAA